MSHSNRKYIAVISRSKISMPEAVIELTANAFKLLSLIYYGHISNSDLQDKKAMKILGVSRHPYLKAKDELKIKGYIKIVQVGSTKYKWFVGKNAIRKDTEKYDEAKKKKKSREFAELVLGVDNNDENEIPKAKQKGVYVVEGFEQDLCCA